MNIQTVIDGELEKKVDTHVNIKELGFIRNDRWDGICKWYSIRTLSIARW